MLINTSQKCGPQVLKQCDVCWQITSGPLKTMSKTLVGHDQPLATWLLSNPLWHMAHYVVPYLTV